MSYQHILVAVDLGAESHLLVEKAIKLAKPTQAKLSLIHVEVLQDDEFTRKIVSSLVAESGDSRVLKESHVQMKALKDNADYPIEHTLIGCGGLSQELEDAIKEYEVDLIICGHHQDFWHNVNSSAKQVMKSIPIDMLVVPLK
jgi:universal stress protein A